MSRIGSADTGILLLAASGSAAGHMSTRVRARSKPMRNVIGNCSRGAGGLSVSRVTPSTIVGPNSDIVASKLNNISPDTLLVKDIGRMSVSDCNLFGRIAVRPTNRICGVHFIAIVGQLDKDNR